MAIFLFESDRDFEMVKIPTQAGENSDFDPGMGEHGVEEAPPAGFFRARKYWPAKRLSTKKLSLRCCSKAFLLRKRNSKRL